MPDLPQILSDVLDRPDSDRSAFLDGACGNNASLRAEIELLIEAHEKADSFLAKPLVTGPAVDATMRTTLSEGPGTVIDKYKLLQLIGEGGFGAVYMAEQRQPVKRRVALKIIKLGMDTKQVIARFEAERQALAMMDHPNIARVLDAGATETGRPYFVMELVKGVSITEYCDTENLTTKKRLDLFMKICNAVQHAHQKGIIHRDLKPSNVMVTLHDGKPVPKVIDFGIAKATNQELTSKTLFTEYRQFIGTPEYMSPEQAQMSGLDIDTRSDIYSLGVLLYELLTGVTPFDGKRLRSAAINEIQRIIREEEPSRPSTRLSELSLALPSPPGRGVGDEGSSSFDAARSSIQYIAKHRRTDPASLSKQLRGDLDWIVMKALEKDRSRRYETANGFAADVQRHLDDEPVVAGPPSAGYRLRKFVRRNRTGVMTACAVLALLLAGIAGTTWGLFREQAAKRAESQQRQIAEQKTTEAQDNLKLAQAQEQKANASRDEAQKQTQRAEEARLEAQTQRDAAHRQSYVANIIAAQANIQAGEIQTARVRLDEAPAELRSWEWKSLHAQLDQSIAVLRGHESGVESVAFSPDGSRIASGSLDHTVRLWDASSGQELAVLRGRERDSVHWVAFSPDGSLIAAAEWDGTVRLWDASTGDDLLVLRGHEWFVNSVAFSPDGTRIVSGSGDTTVRLWDVSSGEQLRVLRGHEGIVTSVAFSPDGSRIASGAKDKTVRLWDASSGQELAVLSRHESAVWSVAFSPEGSRIASASSDKTVRLWDAASGEELLVLRGHDSGVTSVAFSPEGSRVASGSYDKTVRLWDAASGDELVVVRGHESGVASVAFSPDGSRIASGSFDNTLRLWDAARGEELLVLRGHEGQVYSASFSPDGLRIASGSNDHTVRLWDATSRQALAVLRGHEDNVSSVAFSPNGSRIASGSADKTVRLWHADTGEQLLLLRGHEESVNSVVFSPEGSRIASGSGNRFNVYRSTDNTVRLWDADSGEQLLVLRGHERPVVSVAFSPEGSRIASGSYDTTVRLWDAVSGEELLVLRGHEGGVTSVAFSPEGSRIASGSSDKTVRLWDVSSGEELAVLRGTESEVKSIAFSPDGSRIASGASGTVRLWDASTGDELRVLRGHESSVTSVAFSPEGSRIVSASLDSTVRLWDTVPYRERIAERDEARRDRETIRSLVEELFRKGLNCSAIAEKVRTDETLSEPHRHAAINLVLKRCSAIHEQANSLIDDVGKHVVFAADIQAAVLENTSLEPAVHAAAVNIARWIGDSPGRLYSAARRIVDDDDRSPTDYEQAQKAMEVWREHVDQLRAATPADNGRLVEAAVELIEYGMALLKNDQAKDAEPVLRQCLSIREEVLGKDNWLIANARSNLGESLAKQARFRDAQPLLIDSANALMENDKARFDRTNEAIQRVVDLYEAWHAAEPGQSYEAKAAQWRAKLPESPDRSGQEEEGDE